MKAIKCILPTLILLFVGLIGQAQVATKTADVNTKAKEATCQKVCTSATNSMAVKLGLCTPEQAAKCKPSAQCKGFDKNTKMASAEVMTNAPKATKVAAVSKERVAETITAAPKVKGKECAKTCVKTCGSAKKEN